MHQLKPAIVHQDLKPENTLVNKYCVTKICDMGLSKSSEMPTALHTTAGHHFKGTVSYMAPEILIRNEQASFPADVWALGCMILEIYKEDDVWDFVPTSYFKYATELGNHITKVKKPKLSCLPIVLQGVISACFEHDPQKRARASTLLDIFNLLETDEST